ncbi:hypothetical protein KCU88_g299, partial [Aureobasidium melanogenum]
MTQVFGEWRLDIQLYIFLRGDLLSACSPTELERQELHKLPRIESLSSMCDSTHHLSSSRSTRAIRFS